MNDAAPMRAAPAELAHPQARLAGDVGEPMLRAFLEALSAAESGEGPFVLELTTSGGDADIGRRIAADVRLFRERTGRRTVFLGKAVVYSAGVTIMAAFPREDRWLARETTLLIHCRAFARNVELNGPLKLERARVEALLDEIDVSIDMEEEGFARLIEGTGVGLPELLERAKSGWFARAEEALTRGLVAGVL